jgi:hypothetical protein
VGQVGTGSQFWASGDNAVIETMLRIPTEFAVVKIKVTKAGEDRIRRLTAIGPFGACLGCEHVFTEQEVKDGYKKCGQCETCYNGTMYRISKGQTTRKKVCEDGFMLPPSPGGRKPANDFLKNLSES